MGATVDVDFSLEPSTQMHPSAPDIPKEERAKTAREHLELARKVSIDRNEEYRKRHLHEQVRLAEVAAAVDSSEALMRIADLLGGSETIPSLMNTISHAIVEASTWQRRSQ